MADGSRDLCHRGLQAAYPTLGSFDIVRAFSTVRSTGAWRSRRRVDDQIKLTAERMLVAAARPTNPFPLGYETFTCSLYARLRRSELSIGSEYGKGDAHRSKVVAAATSILPAFCATHA
eukprot:6214835-Pleurochrysis_carterae.AAC.4